MRLFGIRFQLVVERCSVAGNCSCGLLYGVDFLRRILSVVFFAKGFADSRCMLPIDGQRLSGGRPVSTFCIPSVQCSAWADGGFGPKLGGILPNSCATLLLSTQCACPAPALRRLARMQGVVAFFHPRSIWFGVSVDLWCCGVSGQCFLLPCGVKRWHLDGTARAWTVCCAPAYSPGSLPRHFLW